MAVFNESQKIMLYLKVNLILLILHYENIKGIW